MKKKTKARGRSRIRGNLDTAERIQHIKESSRRKTKTRKKYAKQKKRKLKKKIEEERKKLERRRKFLVETSKLHRDSRIETTPNNLEIALIFIQGLKVPTLPFDIIETILIETDKYTTTVNF